MKYPAAITLAIGAFFIIGYFLYREPHLLPVSAIGASDAAFVEDVGPASDISATLGAETLNALSSFHTSSAQTETYRDARYGFSLLYPSDLKITIFDEGGGARTITFENTADVKGFQIFIVPYQEKKVSMARFREDDPSGVMEQPKNILVGGTKATMFFSTHAEFGDTVEVWAIKNGYLFEITAPKPLTVWLATIMQTWEFL